MQITKTYKYKLYRCKKQKALHQQINMFCWVYNHCIALHKRYYSLYGKYLNKVQLKKHLTKIKKRDKKVWKQLPSQAMQDVVERIDKSYQLFFSNIKSKKRGGTPRFRKREQYKSFTLKQAGWKLLEENKIQIGDKSYSFHKSRDVGGEIKTLTVKRDSLGDIYIYFAVQETLDGKKIKEENQNKITSNKVEGFDFGLKDFLVDSEGNKFPSPQYHKQSLKQLRKAHRNLSRKQKGSNNRKKARLQVARMHQKVANQRKDFLMKLARKICLDNDVICFEDLSLKGMNKMWGRKMSDLAFGEFISYLQYFCQLFGTKLVKADRFFPSTHICSECGTKREEKLSLWEREWACQECGCVHERDRNAAKNLRNWAIAQFDEEKTVGASTVGGEDVRPSLIEAGNL